MRSPSPQARSSSRRDFLKSSAVGTMAAGLTFEQAVMARAYAAEDSTIPIALVGCGGRGTGAAVQALSTVGPTTLVAMADVFPDRLQDSLQLLNDEKSSQVNVPPDRQYLGFDAYQKAIDCVAPSGVVLLATPPAFRPIHLEYAVEKGVHVFMEKSFAVDAPGVRRVLQAGETARAKNLKIAGGLMSRHYRPLEDAVQRIHDGAIGHVITCYAYRMHTPVGLRPRSEGENELQHQIRNYSNFTWLNGSFLLDWLIHNLDVCCWVKDAWPVSAQGQGGRQCRTAPDQLYDHMAVEYTFPDGTRLVAQGRHMHDCYGFFGDVIHGATGCAVLGEGVTDPKIFAGFKPETSALIWRYRGEPCNAYQAEHDLFFEAIRHDLPYNEAERCAKATLTGILGRIAMETGEQVTWDQALASSLVLAPGLEQYTINSTPPVLPDAQGAYPIANPEKLTIA